MLSLTLRGPLAGPRVTARAAKPAAFGLLGQVGVLSESGTACRPRLDPPGVPRGYRGSGPVISGVLRAGAGVILVRPISRGHSTGSDAAGDVTFAPKSGHWVQNRALSR